MKRARVEEGFNPVYPYGADQSGVLVAPPFVGSDGLQEDPPGVLSLKIERPLTFSDTRALALAIGRGLEVNNGFLEATVNRLTATSPLEYTEGVMSLNTGDTLKVENGVLQTSLTASSPLSLASNVMSLLTGNGLSVSNGRLNLNLQASTPLSMTDNQISLNYTAPLSTTDSNLALSYISPLTVSNSSLGLNYTAPLNVSNGQLGLAIAAPMQVSNSNLTIRLNSSSGLRVAGSGLQIQAGWGIQIARNNDITLKRQDPIAIYESGSNEGILYLKKDADMFTINNSGELQLRIATNSCLVFNSGLQVNVGNGLEKNNNQINVKLGNGISFDSNNALQVNLSTQNPTMWTTLSPQENVCIKNAVGTETANNAKMTLSLTKVGPMVMGLVSVVATGAPINNISVDRATTVITFNGNGEIQSGISQFGVKNGNNIDTSSNVSKVQFMPNTTAYPQGNNADIAASYIQVDGFLNKLRTKPCPLIIVLNGEADPFSIRFIWQLESYKNNGNTLTTSTYAFSYFSQTQD